MPSQVKPKKKKPTKVVVEKPITQDEMLLEAAFTEIHNTRFIPSLKPALAIEMPCQQRLQHPSVWPGVIPAQLQLRSAASDVQIFDFRLVSPTQVVGEAACPGGGCKGAHRSGGGKL